MRKTAKTALAAIGFAITLFLACSDYPALNFPSEAEVNQRYSGLSSSGGVTDCDDENKCAGRCFDPATQFCSGGIGIYAKCGGLNYSAHTKNQICCGTDILSSALYDCCEGTSYLTEAQGCKEGKVLTKCGVNGLYDPEKEFCSSNNTVHKLCNGLAYEPPEQSCVTENGKEVVKGKCGNVEIDFNSFFCFNNISYSLCGGSTYDPRKEFCSNNIIYDKCNNEPYNPMEKFCSGAILYNLCGGEDYNPESQFCFTDNKIYPKCEGGREYNPTNQYCQTSDDKLYSCGNKPFNPSTQFCNNNATIYDKCGGTVEYAPATEKCCGSDKYTTASHFCYTDNNIYRICKADYNPLEQYCHTDNELYSCGNKPRNPDTQFCYNNTTVANFCRRGSTTEYDPSIYECKTGFNGIYLKGGITDARDSKKYNAVLIGTQVWMAENLNHRTPGGASRCQPETGNTDSGSDEDNINCNIYGRLYNKATVTSTTYAICPTGWHLPTYAEWGTLSSSTNPGSNTCPLKGSTGPTNLWRPNPNGTYINLPDTYGFKALPGGGYYPNSTFGSVGVFGYWWCSNSSDVNSRDGYALYVEDSHFSLVISSQNKGNNQYDPSMMSVRCVKD